MKESRSLLRDPERLLGMVARGQAVRVPATSDLHVVARLFEGLDPRKPNRYPLHPDIAMLRRLVLLCRNRTDVLVGHGASRYAAALLALSAHRGGWVRQPEDWVPRSHNARRQFGSLVRHLTARYEVPAFMDTAWLEGLTLEGVVHQRWFLHVAQGRNIRTAIGLPVPMTKKQAHLYLRAPDDFDVLAAFRWAQILDLGGDERLVRSVLASRIGTSFEHDEFWLSVFRWLVSQPMLDPVHHAPLIDYLNHRRFVASVPNPAAHLAGQPRLVPPQPNLTMKGRDPAILLRSVAEWHRRLGRDLARKGTCWEASRFAAFTWEEGLGETRKVYTISELLCSRKLDEEGRAMGHCVGSYAASCGSGRVSIWSLRVTDAVGQESRLLTLEVSNAIGQIIQARRKYNQLPSPKERSILRRWADVGGPSPSQWLAR